MRGCGPPTTRRSRSAMRSDPGGPATLIVTQPPMALNRTVRSPSGAIEAVAVSLAAVALTRIASSGSRLGVVPVVSPVVVPPG